MLYNERGGAGDEGEDKGRQASDEDFGNGEGVLASSGAGDAE